MQTLDIEMIEQITNKAAEKAVKLYSVSHPVPASLNIKQAAELLGKSWPTVKSMVEMGTIKRNALGEIPTTEVYRLLGAKD